MFLVDGYLKRAAERTPEKIALSVPGASIAYGALDALCNQTAAAFAARGLRRDERVLIVAENGVAPVEAAFGAMRCGAAFSLLHPATKPRKIADIVARFRPSLLILGPKQSRSLAEFETPLDSSLPVLEIGSSFEAARDAASPNFVAPARTDLDLAAVFWTSGSTGVPKGVMLTHQNMKSTSVSISTYLENDGSDVVLSALPLSFGYGWFQVTAAFRVGARVCIEQGFTMAYPLIAAIARERATGLPGVPTLFALLLSLREIDPEMLASLRYWTVAGAAMAPAHIARMRELAPKAKPYIMYGLTECTRVTYLSPEDLAVKPMSVGCGMPNQDCWVERENGERTTPGEVGELIIRGANVMRGYFEDEAATRLVLRQGRRLGEVELKSGDFFKTDADGYLYFVGRKDDVIKSGGQKVSPREIEAVLLDHPAIAEAAVIPVDDALLGQVAKAFVVLHDGATLDERALRQHLVKQLEDYMVPKHYAFVDGLPKSDNGKILKRELK